LDNFCNSVALSELLLEEKSWVHLQLCWQCYENLRKHVALDSGLFSFASNIMSRSHSDGKHCIISWT